MANESPHTLATLDVRITAQREVMDERDQRYAENRKCDQDAVKLAKEIADKAKGTVNIVGLIAVVSLILAVADRFK